VGAASGESPVTGCAVGFASCCSRYCGGRLSLGLTGTAIAVATAAGCVQQSGAQAEVSMLRDMEQSAPMEFIPLISMGQADVMGEESKAQVMRACAGWAARNAITRTATNWTRRFIRRTNDKAGGCRCMCAASH
jgi:hypothetical protein